MKDGGTVEILSVNSEEEFGSPERFVGSHWRRQMMAGGLETSDSAKTIGPPDCTVHINDLAQEGTDWLLKECVAFAKFCDDIVWVIQDMPSRDKQALIERGYRFYIKRKESTKRC